jgi:hypothetical protein
MDKPDISNLSTYLKIKHACGYVIGLKDKKSSTNTISSADLFTGVKQNFPHDFPQDFAKNTFYQYLSNTVRDTESSINCLGKRKGYYLRPLHGQQKLRLTGQMPIFLNWHWS